jgi:hypothetical protein
VKGLTCAGCGDGWREHDAPDDYGSGACQVRRCPCNGFRWLDPVPDRELRRLQVLDDLRVAAARPRRRGGRPLAPGRVRRPA